PIGLDDEVLGWFVGLCIAEGSMTGDTIQISGHVEQSDRIDRLRELVNAYHGTLSVHNTGDKACQVHINSRVINGILDTYVGGRTGRSKHLSAKCWQRSDRFLRALLEGYLSGDGHYDVENRRWRLGFTENRDLEADLRTLCARLGVGIRMRAGSV